MELGERLRQARQEAGLSQRQLCGQTITRNMLSQIENGSARPSVDTLQYLARQLGKPVSYFLAEAVQTTPDRMAQLRQTEPRLVLELLRDENAPTEPERYLLEALACLELAQTAIEEGKLPYAARLLEQSEQAEQAAPYYTAALRRRRLLLCHRAKTASAAELVKDLPPMDEELYLRAQAALEAEAAARCQALLEAAESRSAHWHLLMGQALLLQKDYAMAAEQLQQAKCDTVQVYALLEQCYSALGDYKRAYEYACKQR